MFLIAPLLTAQNQEPEIPAQKNAATGPLVTVLGTVLNAANNQPLPRALVRIEGDAANGALTDGEGHFEIPGIPSGPQAFQVFKPGYRDPNATGAMNADGPRSSEHNVLLAAEMPELVFALAPNNSIRGQVSVSTGDAASGIDVSLLWQAIEHGRAVWRLVKTVKTGPEGTYRFGALPDGLYVVYTNPSLENTPLTTLVEPGKGGNVAHDGYAPVFYPSAQDLAGAVRIRLAAGEQAEADMILTPEPFYAVTAKVLSPNGRLSEPGEEGGILVPALMDTEGHYLPYNAQYDGATNTIQAVLPNGTYMLTVVSAVANRSSAEAAASQSHSHPSFVAGSTQFQVAGEAAGNLQLTLTYPRSYLLTLRAEPNGSSNAQSGTFPANGLRSAVRVSLGYAGEYRAEPESEKTAVDAGPDSVDLMVAPPFSFWVHTLVYGRGLCAGSLEGNGVDLAREPLTISFSGSAAPLELTLRNDCAQLNLNLPQELTGLVPGIEPAYTVYVVPDFDSTEDVQPRTVRPTSGGSLPVDGLTPGSYHVYTFAAPVNLEYRNPEAMAHLPTQGQAVTLAPGSTTDLVLEVPGH